MKRYYLSEKDNVIGGVCGGFGEYFNIDPLFIRLAFIFSMILLPKTGFTFITDGSVIAFYLIMWFAADKKRETPLLKDKKDEQDIETRS